MEHRTYYDNDNIKSVINIDDNGVLNGMYQEYYPNGHLKISTNYRNGFEHGIRVEYDNGYVISKYDNGKLVFTTRKKIV